MRTPRTNQAAQASEAAAPKGVAASSRKRRSSIKRKPVKTATRKPTATPAKPVATTTSLSAGFAANRANLDAMAKVASRFEAWRPALEVCTSVRAVPTVFAQLDEITRVGGWPIERFGLVHGPSNEGKTAFLIGLMLSFLLRNHFAALVDAERTTPKPWLVTQMGELATHPGFSAIRPTSYEATVDAVRQWCTTIGDAKAKGEIPPDTSGLVVVDSLRKLVPKKLLATLMKEGSEEQEGKGGKRGPKQRGIDGFGGRAGQMKAALNAAWLDEMVPLLGQTGTAMIVVARESENPDAGPWDPDDFKVTGGKAIYYDSSMVIRVVREGWLRNVDDQGEARDVGERHRIEVRKTKVGHKEERVPFGFFHTSNGVITPAGFDRARDVLELAKRIGVVTGTGWLSWGDTRLGQGEPNALRRLYADATLLDAIEADVRGRFVLDGSDPESMASSRPATDADRSMTLANAKAGAVP